MMQLEDRVVIVAGGGQGIGLAVSRQMQRSGGTVVVWDLRPPKDDPLEHAEVDITDEDAVRSATDIVLDRYGRVDVLYNNAGIVLPGSTGADASAVDKVHLLSIEGLRTVLEVNVVGTFVTCRAVLPSMIRQHGGVIINTASAAAHSAFPAQAAYTASKGAVMTLTRQMATDYGPDGVRVLCISPGRIDTPMLQNLPAVASDPGIRKRLASDLPIRRLGRGEDIANLACFLASDKASYLTGATFNIDGGFTAR